MKTLLIASALVASFSSFAGPLTIANSHQVDRDGQIFRGREPKEKISELPGIGITDVIIFKNDVKGEVPEEIEGLKKLGIRSHHIPFRWKQYPSMVEACEQIVDGINLIKKIKKNGGKVFFHCTAGEDRTGTLAGLYRMLEDKISANEAFEGEMCGRGFSDGNPHKPEKVTSAIEQELTPLFVALSKKVEKGEWKFNSLTKASCKNLKIAPTSLRCN